jgi:hypothetical protein
MPPLQSHHQTHLKELRESTFGWCESQKPQTVDSFMFHLNVLFVLGYLPSGTVPDRAGQSVMLSFSITTAMGTDRLNQLV